MWQGVTSRKHKPIKIFPFGNSSDELMLYGTVDYGLQNGKSLTADWGARAHLVKEGSGYKMDFYQVYTVSSRDRLSLKCLQRQRHPVPSSP